MGIGAEEARKMRVSMNEMTTYRWTFEQDVAAYARAGFSAIGIWRQKVADCGEARAQSLLSSSGLAVSNLLWAGGFTGHDGRSLRESIDDAAEAIRLAQLLGAGTLVVYSGPRGGHTHNHARRLVREALKELLPQAAELGVVLAIEPMHAQCATDWTFLTCLEETLAFIDGLGNTALKMVFDTYQLGFPPPDMGRVAEAASRVAVVHLGDGRAPPQQEQNRCRLGEGVVPLAELVAALRAGGFDGYFDVELLGEDIEASQYEALLDHSQQACQRLAATVAAAG